jgi:hypothetical protein
MKFHIRNFLFLTDVAIYNSFMSDSWIQMYKDTGFAMNCNAHYCLVGSSADFLQISVRRYFCM